MADVVFLISLISGCASIIALVLAIYTDWHGNRRRALCFTAVFVITILFSGGVWYSSREPDHKNRVLGLLESAHSELTDAVRGLQIRLSDEEAGLSSPLPPRLPEVLGSFMTDGEAFRLLSKPMQERLPQFIKAFHVYTEGYKEAKKHPDSDAFLRDTISRMFAESLTQEVCVRLERDYQANRLASDVHQQRFEAALSYQTALLFTGFPWKIDLSILQPSQLTDDQVASYAFWAGYEYDAYVKLLDAIKLLDAEPTPTEELLAVVHRIEHRLHKLGLPIDLQKVLSNLSEKSEPAETPTAMLRTGLRAYDGISAVATFTLGLALSSTLDIFESYLTDQTFHREFFGGVRTIENEGASINANINEISLSPELKKQWKLIYKGVSAGDRDPQAIDRMHTWKENVLASYRHSAPESRRYSQLTDDQVASYAFWAGYEYDDCVKVLAAYPTPVAEQLVVVRGVEHRLHKLGLPIDLHKLLTVASHHSKGQDELLAKLGNGLRAYNGIPGVATFTLGWLLSTRLDILESYLADPNYRKTFRQADRNIMHEIAPIGTNVYEATLSPELKKQWGRISLFPILLGAHTAAGEVAITQEQAVERVQTWKKDVLAYYRDLASEFQ